MKKTTDITSFQVSTIQFLGVLVGTVIYGHLGDRFGRRPVSFCGILIGIIFGVGSGKNSWNSSAFFKPQKDATMLVLVKNNGDNEVYGAP